MTSPTRSEPQDLRLNLKLVAGIVTVGLLLRDGSVVLTGIFILLLSVALWLVRRKLAARMRLEYALWTGIVAYMATWALGPKLPGALFERSSYEASVAVCVGESPSEPMYAASALVERGSDPDGHWYRVYTLRTARGTLDEVYKQDASGPILELLHDASGEMFYVDLNAGNRGMLGEWNRLWGRVDCPDSGWWRRD